MQVTDSTERSRARALVVGGYLEDIEVSGSGHNARIIQATGGSGFNVANCLSLFGVDVLFLSCFGPGESSQWEFKSIPIRSECSRGKFLFRKNEVLAVEKPSTVGIEEELIGILLKEEFDLIYSTLEIGQSAAATVSAIKSRLKVLDPSPGHEYRGNGGLSLYDLILANDYMAFDKKDKRVITKASSKGASYGGHDYKPRRIGESRFGSGDLFGAILSIMILAGRTIDAAIREAVEISSEFCYQERSLEQFVLHKRAVIDNSIRG
ncbi:carbohydrate kinase [Mesotoga sp. SC_NapDC2]|nr:carbohydrate kinase [Mesotoga sp. SC_NapDC3]PXF34662.1 carbohydrate kinase [Mesotoga sp. SC_NapDC]RIZ61759.1 carbohydrate kinase [Mesotoga sp. SC_NapDC2]